MKLTDYKGEDAIDLLADIIDPVTEIFADEDFQRQVKGDTSNLKTIKYLLKNHKAEIIEIMARVDGENPETYKPNVFTLPLKLIELFSDEDFLLLFQSQGQEKDDKSSGSATENTEGEEK